MDPSNGWEAIAPAFIRDAAHSRVGVAIVAGWVQQLPRGCDILDLGCGPGGPRSEPLHARGTVYALDASPSLAQAYATRFPTARVACEPAELTPLFERTFDGILAWGLLFLLSPEAQAAVIQRVGPALNPGGRFMFTAPWQACTWPDNSTGRESVSLGRDAYRDLLGRSGLVVVAESVDDGANHYYDAVKRTDTRV